MSDSKSTEKSVIQKRAQYEQFEFTVCQNGIVNVKNVSHGESGHVYSVDVVGNRIENICSCPAAEHGHVDEESGLCKHATAIQGNEIVLKASESALMTDGGTEVEDTCENGNPFCEGPEGERLPCFDCFKSGDIDL